MEAILIIVIGIILIILSIKSIKNEDSSFKEILKIEEVRKDRDYDLEIISIRKDLAESLLDLQREIEVLKEEIDKLKENRNDFDNRIVENDFQVKKDIISSIDFSNRVEIEENINLKNDKLQKVKLLLEKGITEDKICNELSIGKGEVLLIKSLLKN